MSQPTKKVYDGYADSFAIEKVSVGFDKYKQTLVAAEAEFATSWYPAYNVRKTSATDYAIDLDVTGYNKQELNATIESGALTVAAPAHDLFPDADKDDTYYHQGIFPGGDLNVKFYIADDLKLDSANYDDGILTFTFKATGANQQKYVVPIGPFEKPVDATPYVQKFNSAGEPLGPTGEVLGAVEPSVPYVAPDRTPITVTVNADSDTAPTVQVNLPDPVPQIVEVTATAVANTVDLTSPEPQAVLNVKDATYEVQSNDVVAEAIKSPEGSSDIVVATPSDVHEELATKGIDTTAVVEEAIKQAEATPPALPPASVEESATTTVVVNPEAAPVPVAVVVPDTLPSVVEATVDASNKVVLADTSESIPADATLTPVVTTTGEPDIVVATTPETDKALESLGIDVATDVSSAVVKADSEVAPAPVESAPVFEANATSVVVNADSNLQPTVAVNLPDPLPQIVQVEAAGIAPTVEVANTEPQATLNVTEAVHEVPDNVTTDVIKTESGKTDIVVATDSSVHQVLEDKGINVGDTVAAAITEAGLTPPVAPVIEPTPLVATPITVESGQEVTLNAPETIPQVVQANVETTAASFDSSGVPQEPTTSITLSDVSNNIPTAAEVIPVVTAPGEHDVMVAVTPEDKAKLDALGVDIAKDVGAALQEAQTEVVPATPVTPETSTVTVNADSTTSPTIEVTTPTEVPSIVQATLSDVSPTISDLANNEPQATVTLTDATANVAPDSTLTVVKTDDATKPDIVVATTPETTATAEAAGIDIPAAVSEVINSNDNPVIPAPAVEVAETTAVPESVVVQTPEATAPSVTVTVPETVSPVVDVTPTPESTPAAPILSVTPSDATSLSPDNILVPIPTAEGTSDIVASVSPQVSEDLKAAGVDLANVVSSAVIQAAPEVATSPGTEAPTPAPEAPAPVAEAPAPVVEPVAPAPEPTPEPVAEAPAPVVEAPAPVAEVVSPAPEPVVEAPAPVAEVIPPALEPTPEPVAEAPAPAPEPTPEPVAEAPAPAPEAPAPTSVTTGDSTTVTVNADVPTVPTVEVTTPTEVPPIVQATLSDVAPTVDTASPEPQATVTLSDATANVAPDSTLTVVKTDDAAKPDIVVATTPETTAAATEAGVDIPAAVEAAVNATDNPVTPAPVETPAPAEVETTPVVVATPEASVESVTVAVPDAIATPVVEVAKAPDSTPEAPSIVVTPTDATNLPAENVVVPVETAGDANNIVASVPPEVNTELAAANVDVSDVLSTAVQAEVAAAPDNTTPVVLNAESNTVPTVQVNVPDQLPQVVEVVPTEPVPATVDVANTEPQVVLNVNDATKEIVADNVVTGTIATPAGSADTVIAVPTEVHEALANVGVDAVKTVQDAVAQAEPTPAPLPDTTAVEAANTVTIAATDAATDEPKVTVVTPEVIPQVVEATVETPTEANTAAVVTLSDTSENIDPAATLTPVVTANGQPDIVVATNPPEQAKLDAAGVNLATDVGQALQDANVAVVTSESTPST